MGWTSCSHFPPSPSGDTDSIYGPCACTGDMQGPPSYAAEDPVGEVGGQAGDPHKGGICILDELGRKAYPSPLNF